MTGHRVSTGLLAIALVLMAWGSLRGIITPGGYWGAWLLWATATVLILNPWRGLSREALPPLWVIVSYGVLVAGMLLSGMVNQDTTTLYQAVKIMVICGLFWVMWMSAVRAEPWQLIRALHWVMLISVLGFFISKTLLATSYDLGGRQGAVFALPGVIWKAGLFFLPVFLAGLIARPRSWVMNSLAIAACLFLLFVDGSRTGLLLAPVTLVAVGAVLWWRGEWRLLWQRPLWLPSVVGCLLCLLLLNTGINTWRNGSVSGGGAEVTAIVDGALASVVDNRLGSGDAPRLRLLSNGLEQSEACFPLGCGFGSTAIDAGYGIPMNVHNAYLGALADFGLIGLLGMLGFVVAALLPFRILREPGADVPRVYFVVAVAGSALAYCVTLMLHTFTSEMSEWGYLVVMLAFAWAPPQAQS